jgi:PAS domain S-box-containing protein
MTADDDVASRAEKLHRELQVDPFRAMWELAADAIALSDEDGTVLLANAAYLELYGYSAEEVIGQNFAVIFPEEQRAWARDVYRSTFDDPNPPTSFESVVQRKDGAERTVEARIGFIEAPTGERAAMVNVIRDITLRRRAEEAATQAEWELQRTLEAESRARGEAETALRQRDEFLATVSHDLQNPLSAIRGNAQLLGRFAAHAPGEDSAVGAELASAILGTVDQMSAQVADLVDLAREAAGHELLLDPDTVDLAELAREVLTAYGEVLAHHPVRLDADEAEVVGHWDRVRLRRVIANLLVNAAKYSPPGAEVVVAVARKPGPEGSFASLTVRDNGVGIDREDLPRIFERFYRGASVSSSVRGNGLGLASAQHIVRAHGGTITVESEPGVGSTFTVALPL